MSESLASKRIHQLGIPLLLSELLLRDFDCGQIDLARIKDEKIQLFEVKSSMRISKKQISRLQKARCLVEHILDKEGELALYICRDRGRFDWIPML